MITPHALSDAEATKQQHGTTTATGSMHDQLSHHQFN
jgi:hypothetical protein